MAQHTARRDALLDAVALTKGHIDGDDQAVLEILASCNMRNVATVTTHMLASMLRYILDEDELESGLDQLRAIAFIEDDG